MFERMVEVKYRNYIKNFPSSVGMGKMLKLFSMKESKRKKLVLVKKVKKTSGLKECKLFLERER
jgi:hypothetical protein